jgi:hypothetical protein
MWLDDISAVLQHIIAEVFHLTRKQKFRSQRFVRR